MREDVVDVAAALGHVGFAPVFPALHEKLFHVVVRDGLGGWHDVATGRLPRQTVAARKLARVQCRKYFQFICGRHFFLFCLVDGFVFHIFY